MPSFEQRSRIILILFFHLSVVNHLPCLDQEKPLFFSAAALGKGLVPLHPHVCGGAGLVPLCLFSRHGGKQGQACNKQGLGQVDIQKSRADVFIINLGFVVAEYKI